MTGACITVQAIMIFDWPFEIGVEKMSITRVFNANWTSIVQIRGWDAGPKRPLDIEIQFI